MSDKELLRSAAISCGLVLSNEWDCAESGILIGTGRGDLITWNPLESNGDALEVMVSLGITVEYYDGFGEVWATHKDTWDTIEQPYGDDKALATRRAIVRAAAAEGIGY